MFDLNWAALALLVFVAAVFVTGMVYRHALRNNILDFPNARSSHFSATPLGGGVSIVVVFLSVVVVLFFSGWVDMEARIFYTFVAAATTLAALGYLDDRIGLSPWSRLAVHVMVVSFAVFSLGVPTLALAALTIHTPWILYPLAIAALLWWINLFNFMDGIDGIAGVQATTILLSALIVLSWTDPAFTLMPWLWILLFSVAGFLLWNWPPARIFMGDAASCFLGLIVGLFALQSAMETAMNVWCWFILFSVFLVDATVTLFIRIYRREKIHQAHRQHAYQRLAICLSQVNVGTLSPYWLRAYAHRCVDLALLSFNMLYLLPLALLAALYPPWAFALAMLAVAPTLWFSWQIRRPYRLLG